MRRIALTVLVTLSIDLVNAAPLVPQEGVVGVAWLSSRGAFKARVVSRTSDFCMDAAALAQSKEVGVDIRNLYAKLNLSCLRESFAATIGSQTFELDGQFDTSDRLVQVSGRLRKYDSNKEAALACRDLHDALSASFGKGAVRSYSEPDSGASLATTTWETPATSVELTCFQNAMKNVGSAGIRMSFAPWKATANQAR